MRANPESDQKPSKSEVRYKKELSSKRTSESPKTPIDRSSLLLSKSEKINVLPQITPNKFNKSVKKVPVFYSKQPSKTVKKLKEDLRLIKMNSPSVYGLDDCS
jgi:hypothetical protein